jgi:FADH2 O2-dependent halogenase
MIGVKAYDAVAPAPGRHDMPRWWAEGTLHHIFKGGWIWVIPFDNHKWSTSPLCSVGMQLDPRIHPATDRAPDDEFRDVLQRYPTVARQFADARAVRGWNTAGRLQYSSTRSSGGRWFLLAHAYAFVDPLFSRGLTNTLETIHSLVPRICAALREGSFPAERFGELEFQQRDMFDNNDQLVAHSYRSFRSFETWNAWNRVWTLGIFYGAARLVRAYNMFKAHGDPQFIDALDTPLVHRTLAPTLPMFEPIFQQSMQLIRDADEERIPTAEAASRIFAMLGSLDICPPPFRLDDPDAILTDFRMPVLLQILRWAKTQAPAVVRDTFFDFPSQGVAKEIGKRLLSRHLMTGKGTLHMHQLGDGDLPSHLLTPELRPHG